MAQSGVRSVRAWLAATFLGWLLSGATAAYGESATARIDRLHEALLAAMQCECASDARAAGLQPVVQALFDVTNIVRISTGRAWREFDESQRADLEGALERLIVVTYADRFDSFAGQRFEVLGEEMSRTGAVVRTEIVRSSGERVPIDYYFRGDKVFNVVASGVSDLSLRRADYSSILKEQGYGALLAHIEENIVELSASGE